MPATPQTITVTLGSSYVDRVTGFSGIATARTEYLTGRSRTELSPKIRSNGALPRPEWFEDERLDEAMPPFVAFAE